jgi:hypothetical protein
MHQDIIAFDVHISKEGNPQAGLQTNADEPGTCQDLQPPETQSAWIESAWIGRKS